MANRRRRGAIVAFEGPSGAGKSTLLAEVARRTGWPHLAEAWVRLAPRPSLGYRTPAELLRLETKLLTEEERRWTEARRLADEGEPVLLDTGPLGPLTYTWGLALLDPMAGRVLPALRRNATAAARRGALGLPDRSLYLDTPLELAAHRATGAPETHPVEWRWRHAAVGRIERAFWLGIYSGEVRRSAFRLLDGRREVRTLAPGIARLARERPPRADPSALGRVLRALARPKPPARASR